MGFKDKLKVTILGRFEAENLTKEILAGDKPRMTFALGLLDISDVWENKNMLPIPGWDQIANDADTIKMDDDCVGNQKTSIPVTESNVQAIVNFGNCVVKTTQEIEDVSLLVHCFAGQSRSTAAALVMLSMLCENNDFKSAVDYLISVRPIATPNINIITIADKLLGYDGKLVESLNELYSRKKYGYGL